MVQARSAQTMQGGSSSSVGKKVNCLVQEQLQYCRSLRRADMLSTMQVSHGRLYGEAVNVQVGPNPAQQRWRYSTLQLSHTYIVGSCRCAVVSTLAYVFSCE